MNGEAQLVIGPVRYLVLAERYVSNGKIVEVAPVSGFKSRHGNIRLGVELLGNSPADGIQLHAVQTGRCHALRQEAEEVADTAGRFQNVPGSKAHFFNRLIDGPDNGGACVVGI